MASWKWHEDGRVTVEREGAEPQTFSVRPHDRRALMEYQAPIKLANELTLMLTSAQESFYAGRAKYEGAMENYAHLLGELHKVERQAIQSLRKVDAFFAPDGVAASFGDDLEAFNGFVKELMERLES